MSRSFESAALRRLSLRELADLAEDLASRPTPPDRAAQMSLARYRAAVATELKQQAETGKPTPSRYRGRVRSSGAHPVRTKCAHGK